MKEKITLKKTVQHLLTISKHKAYVAEECFRVGLYRQGLAHDLSKYSPSEFFVGARYYQGDRSPNNAEREDKEMPGRYVIEMFMDRIAASKVYRGKAYTDADPLAYYMRGCTWKFLHPETRALLEKLLYMLRDEGEEKTFSYIKKHLHK